MPFIILILSDFPFRPTRGTCLSAPLTGSLLLFSDMEQYIRDKYERKIFMSNEARASFQATQGAGGTNRKDSNASYGVASPPSSSVWADSAEGRSSSPNQRYPVQMQSLQEMGFSNAKANAEALAASSGNLQTAIESLLSHKTGALSLSQHRSNSSRASDDLVDIFGAPPPMSKEPSQSRHAPTSAPVSILDADLPAPAFERPAESSDDFDDFEAAPASPPVSTKPSFTAEESFSAHRPSLDATHSPFEPLPAAHPPAKNLPSVMNNPWASNNADAGSSEAGAFDDIDPFRGFTPSNRSH